MKTLETGINNSKNVQRYIFGSGTIGMLDELLNVRRKSPANKVVYFVDEFFKENEKLSELINVENQDRIYYVPTLEEPTTEGIDSYVLEFDGENISEVCAIVAVGGGITMDTAKAVANLLTNGGKAEDYQGWDLVKVAGIYKIAVPTISGTGAEATRTCVMTNKRTGLKLGMNSDYTVYDQVILDPDLTSTVPRDQYFWTGMDAYIHCMEALNGSYRNAIGDAFSREAINLCREVFQDDMLSDKARERLMVASYLGGCAIATSYVGIVHPFSAGLSVVLGIHHCVANCIVMRAMEEFYPEGYKEFWQMAERQCVVIPEGICQDLTDEQHEQLYAATVVHEKPLTNALGEKFKDILTPEKVRKVFMSM